MSNRSYKFINDYFDILSVEVGGISTDTRTLMPGDIYFALRGDKFDGHSFIPDAIAKGAAIIVCDRQTPGLGDKTDFPVEVIVPDVLGAYQGLANYYLSTVGPKVIAITGSVGKTSLKDMLASTLKTFYKTHATSGNLNNHIGVPKTILSMPPDTKLLILEMGMSGVGEIAKLVEIAPPDIAIIRNIGLSHNENFQNTDGIFWSKMEIISSEKPSILVIDGDDPRLGDLKSEDFPQGLIKVGSEPGSDVLVRDVRYQDDNLKFLVDDKPMSLPIFGKYNAINVGIAMAVANILNLPISEFIKGLGDVRRTPHRLEVIEVAGIKIIDDTYNAAPESMREALDLLVSQPGRKIAVLADMLELGEIAEREHLAIGRYAVRSGVDVLVGVGDLAKFIYEGGLLEAEDANCFYFEDKDHARMFIKNICKQKDIMLFKGSNSMKMIDLVDSIVAYVGDMR